MKKRVRVECESLNSKDSVSAKCEREGEKAKKLWWLGGVVSFYRKGREVRGLR